VTNPTLYRSFGRTALLPFVRDLWQTLIMPNVVFFVLSLALFELLVGFLLIGKGRPVKCGFVLSILFNLFPVQLGLSSQAAGWMSDFLMNRLPNLVFVAIQVPLWFCEFDRSLLETLVSKPKR
jgi:hypothetical protein